MSSWLVRSLPPSLDGSARTSRRLRNRSLVNLSRMGHCAPTVMIGPDDQRYRNSGGNTTTTIDAHAT